MIRKNEHRTNLALCAGVSCFWLLLYTAGQFLSDSGTETPLTKFEYVSEDLRTRHGRMTPMDERLVFIGLDKQSYRDEIFPDEIESSRALQLMTGKSFPWSREVWALTAERLISSGARFVILDFIFPHESEGDDALRAVIETYRGQIILAANLDQSGRHNVDGGVDTKIIHPSPSVAGDFEASQENVGLINYWLDGDQTVRRLTFNYQIRDKRIPTLAYLILKQSGLNYPLMETTGSHRFRYTARPQTRFKFIPLYEIFVPGMWEANFQSGAYFKDKIVMIGPAANWTQDRHRTPFSEFMFGPELHLQAINAALQNEFITDATYLETTLWILLSGLTAFLISRLAPEAHIRAGLLLLATAAAVAVAWIGFNHFAHMVHLTTALFCLNSAGAACMINQFVRESVERARTRAKMEKYVSQNVVKLMLDSATFEDTLGGKRRPCTILFSDIRGFTTMTESSDSQQLVNQLNEYLTEMVECVFRHDGTLDKFIGDAVMAVWGNATTHGPSADATAAVQTSLDMIEALERLNMSWEKRGIPTLSIGIGLNHGEVIVGHMGSPKRQEFTVIGDAVNLASRLEGTTKPYGLPIIVGESVAELTSSTFILQHVDLIQVKGKHQPVRTFTVLGRTDQPLPPSEQRGLDAYHQGIALYLQRDFQNALECFLQCSETFHRNTLAELYIERCREKMVSPPPEDWDGVSILKEK
ncbi:MAG: CHASE2 domain-containing protein [Candidatus Methylacidiphilales bacterium]